MSWGTNKAGGGLGYTPTATRIPFGNAGGTGQTDSADLTWNDTTKVLKAAGTSPKVDADGSSASFLRNRINGTTVLHITNSGSNLQLLEFQGALRIRDLDTETSRLEILETGETGFFGVTPAARQVRGATLTNSVTSGGSDDVIANYTDLNTYATDAAAIRNNIYQLARAVRMHDVALRAYGLET